MHVASDAAIERIKGGWSGGVGGVGGFVAKEGGQEGRMHVALDATLQDVTNKGWVRGWVGGGPDGGGGTNGCTWQLVWGGGGYHLQKWVLSLCARVWSGGAITWLPHPNVHVMPTPRLIKPSRRMGSPLLPATHTLPPSACLHP